MSDDLDYDSPIFAELLAERFAAVDTLADLGWEVDA